MMITSQPTAATNPTAPAVPAEPVEAIRLAVTMIVAVYLCMLFELDTPAWAAWTVLSVSVVTRANSLQRSFWRASGTILGAATAIAFTAAFGQSTLAFDVALALWVAFVSAAATLERGNESYGFGLMGFTVPLVSLDNVLAPQQVFRVAVDRTSCLLVGIACAHVSTVLVAPGVGAVRTALGETFRTTATCLRIGSMAGLPGLEAAGVNAVFALNDAIVDAFIEQPALRVGGRAISDAPRRIQDFLAIRLLDRQHPATAETEAATLLGLPPYTEDEVLGDLDRIADMLILGVFRPRDQAALPLLARDRDGRQALRNAFRSATAVTIANAYWYASAWPLGNAVVIWAAILSSLFAARADAAEAARSFLGGAAFAALVGVFVHYIALTSTGDFLMLAATILPVCLLAALGQAKGRSAAGTGYGIVVLDIIAPTNPMQYSLGNTLNTAMADLCGIGLAVAAFTALPPPASAQVHVRRTMHRMQYAAKMVSFWPALVLPTRASWLSRMFDRMLKLQGCDRPILDHARLLVVTGMLLLALRRDDDTLGRTVGTLLWLEPSVRGPILRALAIWTTNALQRSRVSALADLTEGVDLTAWPGESA